MSIERMPENTNKSKMIGLKGRIRSSTLAQDGGKKYSAIFSPSNGANGIRLNTIKTRLIQTNSFRKLAANSLLMGPNPCIEARPKRSGIAPRIAIKKLEPGPANDTHIKAAEDRLLKA